jgi:hypothetical protein
MSGAFLEPNFIMTLKSHPLTPVIIGAMLA